MFAPLRVVMPGRLTCGGGGESPHPADVGKPVVLDLPVGDADRASGGAGDRVLTRGRPSRRGRRRTGWVVVDLGEYAGAGGVGPARKAGNDGIIGGGFGTAPRRLAEPVDVGAGGLECGQQRQGVLAHRAYDCSCRAIAFLSTLPTAVVGNAVIPVSTSGRACLATPRWSR